MALDPNISLGLQPMPQLDLTRIQQLRNLMGQEALMGQQFIQAGLQQELSRAQIPLVQAQARSAVATASQLERDVEFNRVQQEIADKFINPATGKMNVDAYTTELQRRGYMDKATPLLQSAAAAEATQLANLRTDQDRSVAASNWFETQASRLGLTLHGMPENLRADAFNKEAAILDQIGPRGLNTAQQLRSLFFTQKADGTVEFNNDKVDALYRARIDALQQENLKIEQVSKFMTDEGKRPDSPISKDLKQALKNQFGITGLDSFSAAQIATSPLLGGYVSRLVDSAVVSSQARTQSDREAKEVEISIRNIDSALTTINRIKKNNPNIIPTIVGQKLGELSANKIILDPDRRELEAAYGEYNRLNPDNKIDSTGTSFGGQEAFLAERKRNLENRLLQLRAASEKPTTAPGQPTVPGRPTEAQARANAAEFRATPEGAEAQRRTTEAAKSGDDFKLTVQEFENAVKDNNYPKAKEAYDELKKRFPGKDLKSYESSLFNLEKGTKTESKSKKGVYTKKEIREFAVKQRVSEEEVRRAIRKIEPGAIFE